MAIIINNLPHPVNIISKDNIRFDASIRKWVADEGTEPIRTLPPSGNVLNAKIDTFEVDPIEDEDDIPCFEKSIEGCDPLPDDGCIHIVSALYASAAAKAGYDMSRIRLTADPVMTPDGKKFVGCRGLVKHF